jgi:cyanophycin synthetase
MVRDGAGDLMVENLLAAVATAWALDIPIEIIRAGTEGFDLQLAGIIK